MSQDLTRRDVLMPEKKTVTDLITGITVCRGSPTFSVRLRPKEVRTFFIE